MPGPAATPGSEMVEVVDARGRVERVVSRAEMRARNLRHRAVAVAVVTSTGEVVAHRRAGWKDVWPGRWDVCFGGVVGVGEGWRGAARRELAEEAGIEVGDADLHGLGQSSYADDDVATHTHAYLVTHDGPFHGADREVAEVVLVPLGDLESWLAGRPLCPDSAALVVPHLRRLAQASGPGGSPPPPSPEAG